MLLKKRLYFLCKVKKINVLFFNCVFKFDVMVFIIKIFLLFQELDNNIVGSWNFFVFDNGE